MWLSLNSSIWSAFGCTIPSYKHARPIRLHHLDVGKFHTHLTCGVWRIIAKAVEAAPKNADCLGSYAVFLHGQKKDGKQAQASRLSISLSCS